MPVPCNNPSRERHDCGDREISIEPLAIKWGDIRDDWQGDYSFCSFRCLADWAAEKAAQHDGHVLQEGVDAS
jgi:hypothetical protein